MIERRGRLGERLVVSGHVQPEGPEDLGAAVAIGGAGGPERGAQVFERLLVAPHQLDLDLPEALDDSPILEDGHGVQHDLRHRSPEITHQYTGATREKGGDGRQVGAAGIDAQEAAELGRNDSRRARKLDL